MTQYTVMGGETCQVSLGEQRTECPTALGELAQFHWDYLNVDFFGNTIDRWRRDGCFGEIEARLGYRFEMRSASADTQVESGGRLGLTVEMANEGFGKLYNPRPLNVVLVDEATGALTRVERASDARTVLPLSGRSTTLDLGIDLPDGLPAGTYRLHLELPDGSSALAGDARYSIRMANVGTWRPATGTNDLGLVVQVGS